MTEELSYSWRAPDGTRIRVTVEPSRTQANVCLFVVEPTLFERGGVHVRRDADAGTAPLATTLFSLKEVAEILIAGGSVTVTTETPVDWNDFAEHIAKLIRDHIISGCPAVDPAFAESLPASDTIRSRVQEVIDTAINPAVASHGGIVTLLDVKGNNIYLEFGGGCQGCGMVSVTLKYGVERLIRQQVPEVGQILDTTDHAAGQNPYYAPSAK